MRYKNLGYSSRLSQDFSIFADDNKSVIDKDLDDD